jgi:hypothetical protein
MNHCCVYSNDCAYPPRSLNGSAGPPASSTLDLSTSPRTMRAFVSVLAINFPDDSPKRLREALIDACCSGSIVTASHDQVPRHLAMCFLLRKGHGMALQMARVVASADNTLPAETVYDFDYRADPMLFEREKVLRFTSSQIVVKRS